MLRTKLYLKRSLQIWLQQKEFTNMVTAITTTDTTNTYVTSIGGVNVTVRSNFSDNTSTIEVEPKITGGALNVQG